MVNESNLQKYKTGKWSLPVNLIESYICSLIFSEGFPILYNILSAYPGSLPFFLKFLCFYNFILPVL